MKKIIIIICVALVFAYILYAINIGYFNSEPARSSEAAFSGSEQCASCHQEIYQSFLETAHFKTSAPASPKNILGSFDPGHNEFHFNSRDKIIMEKTDSGFFQIGFSNDRQRGSQRFDIVIGSGTKGQTYLSWQQNKLIQLPISYYSPDHQWSSSPGYPVDRFVINRPVTAQCLNCHSTFFNVTPIINEAPDFDKGEIMYGVSCERCHGPGADHAALMADEKHSKELKSIINPASLNRRQQLDACAQCHSGIHRTGKAPFEFLPGDSLLINAMPRLVADTSAGAEVHGNQYGLLMASKCFLKSDNLTCSTCHNPHRSERDDLTLFSQRCLSCHQKNLVAKECKLTAELGEKINSNCIDCHMPARSSKKITFRTADQKSFSSEIARTHFISIYPDQAKKIIQMFR